MSISTVSTVRTVGSSTSRPARTGRVQEFGLLIAVFAILELAWFLTDYAFAPDPAAYTAPQGFLKISFICAVVIFGGHFAIRFLAKWADPIIYPSTILLTGIGFVMIHRIDFSLLAAGGNRSEIRGQMLLALLGFTAMLITLVLIRDHRKLRKFTYISLIAGIILLLLPLIPGIGREFQGARIWINAAGFSFQPAEIGKICLVVFFAGYLVVQRDNLALAGKKCSESSFRSCAILLQLCLRGFSVSVCSHSRMISAPRC
ncbi:FtsW/RodA/SpoVE family cell cycle protein [Arcanobacterium hippocoleae]